MSALRVRKILESRDIDTVEILVRSNVNCPFYKETKRLLRIHMPEISTAEYNANAFPQKWESLAVNNPQVNSLPQVTFIMKNKERRHIGGYQEIKQFFEKEAREKCECA